MRFVNKQSLTVSLSPLRAWPDLNIFNNDTSMRQSLLHSNDESDIISLILKESNKNKSEHEIKVDIPFEKWSEGENINIYITSQHRGE
jgi:hypothetical protein